MLSIILSTFNRPQYLGRLLNYYGELAVKYPILIGDASESAHFESNKEVISSVSGVLDIRHLGFDNSADGYEVMYRCLEQVDTEYVVWVHDDDFIVPSALAAAVEFLELHPSYEAAGGKGVAFTTASDGPYATSMRVNTANTIDLSVEGADAADRVGNRMSQSTPLFAPKTVYAVKRTSTAVRLHKEVLALGVDHQNAELAMNQMVMLSGNIKLIDKLFIAKQHHSSDSRSWTHARCVPIITQSNTGASYEPLLDTRLEEKLSHYPDCFDLLVDPLFHVKYERVATCLVNELSRQDGTSIEESRKIIKDWQWYFLAKRLTGKLYVDTGYQPNTADEGIRGIANGLRHWVRQIPGVHRVWQRVRYPNPPGFRADLSPIHRAITIPPAGVYSVPISKI